MCHQCLHGHATYGHSRFVAQPFIFTDDIAKFLSGCIPPALGSTRQNWRNQTIGTGPYQQFFCPLPYDAKKASGWTGRDHRLWLRSTKLPCLSWPIHFHKFGNVLF